MVILGRSVFWPLNFDSVELVKLKSQSCEIETEDACNSNGNPCIKGKCIPIGKNNYRCECIDGYEGEKVCKHVCRNKATCGTGPKSGICVEAEDTYLCICNSEGGYYVIITYLYNFYSDEEFNEETKTCEPNCAAMDPIDRFIKCPGIFLNSVSDWSSNQQQ